jgi:transcriptional regulator with XRE-family HTH domain
VLDQVGRRVGELRRSRGLTQQQVADSVGMLLRDYQAIEGGGRKVTLETVLKVARDGLEVPIRMLFDAPTGKLPRRPGRPPRRAPTPRGRRSSS